MKSVSTVHAHPTVFENLTKIRMVLVQQVANQLPGGSGGKKRVDIDVTQTNQGQ